MNTIKQLPRLMTFAHVVQQGSFTGAAHSLGVTKSAVSQQITQLEGEMGVRLLNRTTRGIALTTLGETLYQRCQLLVGQVDAIFTDIEDALDSPKGRFAITYPHALQSSVVVPAIEQLCQEYPRLEPELIASDQTLDLVKHNLDLAIHAGEMPDSSYRALPVGTMTEVFCATPFYLQQAGLDHDDLESHKWIASSWQKQKLKLRHKAIQSNKETILNLYARANTLPTVLEMALKHMGMVLLPDVIANPLIKKGQLVRISHDITGPLWPVYTLHAYQAEKPIHITRFHKLICQFFNGA